MQKALFQGVKFCPVCGCNIHTVNRALELSMPTMQYDAQEPEPPPIGLQPKPKTIISRIDPRVGKPRRSDALPPGSITNAMKEQMHQKRALGLSANKIAREMGLKVGTVGAIIYKHRNQPKTNGVSHE